MTCTDAKKFIYDKHRRAKADCDEKVIMHIDCVYHDMFYGSNAEFDETDRKISPQLMISPLLLANFSRH